MAAAEWRWVRCVLSSVLSGTARCVCLGKAEAEDGVAKVLEGLVALMESLALLKGARGGKAVAPSARGVGAEEGVADASAALHPARVHEGGGEEQLAAVGEADALFKRG